MCLHTCSVFTTVERPDSKGPLLQWMEFLPETAIKEQI